MAEEQRCQEGHRLCVNNCGFLGNPATLNLCPKCYRDLRLKNDLSSSASSSSSKLTTIEKSPLSPPTSSSSAAEAVSLPELSAEAARSPTPDVEAVRVPQAANRCAGCRRRVGLTGFNCRCGSTFCGAHRHPEQHACSFDFKSPGREAIARANPVIKAAKLHKI